MHYHGNMVIFIFVLINVLYGNSNMVINSQPMIINSNMVINKKARTTWKLSISQVIFLLKFIGMVSVGSDGTAPIISKHIVTKSSIILPKYLLSSQVHVFTLSYKCNLFCTYASMFTVIPLLI